MVSQFNGDKAVNWCTMEGMSYRIMPFMIQMQTLRIVCRFLRKEETLTCVLEREELLKSLLYWLSNDC